MLSALIDLCNKHRPPDANWREVRRSGTHEYFAVIVYNEGPPSGLLTMAETVQFAEVLIQAGTVRALKGEP